MKKICNRLVAKATAVIVATLLVEGLVPSGLFTAWAATGDSRTFTFTVTDGKSLPVVGATVQLVNKTDGSDTPTATADSNGHAVFSVAKGNPVKEGGMYSYTVSKTGYQTVTSDTGSEITVGATDSGTKAVTLSKNTHTFVFTVTDVNSNAVAGATVQVANQADVSDTHSATTDSNGHAAFSAGNGNPLSEGVTYSYTVSAAGYLILTSDAGSAITIGTDNSGAKTVALQSHITIGDAKASTSFWARTKTISATITDSDTGATIDQVFYAASADATSGTVLMSSGDNSWKSGAISVSGVYYIIAHDTNGARAVSQAVTVGNVDTTPPTAAIRADRFANIWSSFLDTITFGLYAKATITVSVTAGDGAGSGVADISYYLGTQQMTTTELDALVTGWQTYSDADKIVLNADRQYIVYVRVTDNVGNYAYYSSDGMVYDDIPPAIQVSYDNTSAQNGSYYSAARTATITVTEHNWQSGDFTVHLTAKNLDGTNMSTPPTIGAWSDNGDIHTATIPFTAQGKYVLDLSYADMAGNAAPAFTEQTFYIDTTTPAVTGLQENTAAWKPSITVSAAVTDAGCGIDPGRVFCSADAGATSGMPMTQAGGDTWVTGAITSNGTYYVIAYDKAGNRKVSDGIAVQNVDTQPPVISGAGQSTGGWSTTSKTIGATVEDSESGLDQSRVFYSTDANATSGTALTNGGGTWSSGAIMKNGTYYIIAYDIAGNRSSAAVQVTGIDLQAPGAAIGQAGSASNIWHGFLSMITFGLYFNGGATFDITATDTADANGNAPSDVAGIWYYDSSAPMSQSEVAGCTQWKPYGSGVTIDTDRQLVLYVKVQDAAGNVSYYGTDGMTFDATAPVVEVTYDNNSAQNGSYYRADRTATIRVTEHNWNPDGFHYTLTAENNPGGAYSAIAAPAMSGWTNSGDVHTATISYTADGRYTFSAECTDLAGNKATFAQQVFYIDKTVPVVPTTLAGIGVQNYVNGSGSTVTPQIQVTDNNIDTSNVTITLTGQKTGKAATLNGSWADIANGRVFTFSNFADQKADDDIYTITVSATDKAGNTATSGTLTFSVNRFGSTFDLSPIQSLIGGYFKSAGDITFKELNPDSVSGDSYVLSLSRDGVVSKLKEGADYTRQATETAGTWSEYTYTVMAKNFTADGKYVITLTSKDLAGNENISDDTSKSGESISFAIDNTKPTATVTGAEKGMSYNTDSLPVTISLSDNLKLKSYAVTLDGKQVSGDTLTGSDTSSKQVSISISSSFSRQSLTVTEVDEAGNQNSITIPNILVNTNPLVQFYQNAVLFYSSIGGLALIILALVIFFVFRKKPQPEKG